MVVVHEVGHYLGLYHTFEGDGNGSSCPSENNCILENDRCCDTPPHIRGSSSSSGCLTGYNSCYSGTLDLVGKNFMNYAPVNCRTNFTQDQVEDRMIPYLIGLRPDIWTIESSICTAQLVGIANPQCSNLGFTFTANNVSAYELEYLSINSQIVSSGKRYFGCTRSGTINTGIITAAAAYNMTLKLYGRCGQLDVDLTQNIIAVGCRINNNPDSTVPCTTCGTQRSGNDPSQFLSTCCPAFSQTNLSQTYNAGTMPIEHIGSSIDIDNTGILAVNSDAQLQYGGVGYPELGSTRILEICNNSIVNVNNGGTIECGGSSNGQYGIIKFLAGSTLHLMANSTLVIHDNSKLIIEDGAEIIYEDGASIQLLGNNAILDIQGKLSLGNYSIFSFTHANNPSGYVRFSRAGYITYDQSDPNYQIVAGIGAKVYLKGDGRSDKILEVAQSNLWFPSNLLEFRVENGSIAFAAGNAFAAQVATDCPIYFNNARLYTEQGNSAGGGLLYFGQPIHTIKNTWFEGLTTGITAYNFYGGAALKVSSSKFNSCGTGIYAVDKGVILIGGIFEYCGVGLGTYGLSFNSYASGTQFVNNNIGVHCASSTIEFKLISCTVNNNQTFGCQSDGSSISLKCSSVQDNGVAGFMVGYDGILRMAPAFGGGYNNCSNNTTTGILDQAREFELVGGLNDLRPNATYSNACNTNGLSCPTVFDGTTQGCSPKVILATKNRWKTSYTNNTYHWPYYNSPYVTDLTSSSNNVITWACGEPVRFSDNSQQPGATCLSGPPNSESSTSAFGPCSTCHRIDTPTFPSTRVNDAAEIALAQMDSSITDGFAIAVSMFGEILSYPISNPETDEQHVLDVCLRKMHEAYADGVANGQIAHDSSSISHEAQIIIDIETLIQQNALANNDYEQRFYSAMREARTLRADGKRADAIAKFDDIISWVQDDQSAYVNYWRCLVYNENQMLTGQLPMDQFITEITACIPIGNALNNNNMIRVHDNSPVYTNPGTLNTVMLFPNPATDEVQLVFVQPDETITATFELFSLTGELIQTSSLSGSATTNMKVDELPGGVYLYRVTVNGQITQQDRLVIVH